MIVRRHATAREFLEGVAERLSKRPVINQLPLALAETCITDPGRYGPDVRFYSIAGDGCALQTPPLPVQLAECSDEGAAALGRTFAGEHDRIVGVSGPDRMAEQFAIAYAETAGLHHVLDTALGVFELRALVDLPAPPGKAIVATAEHAPLLQAWLAAFHLETTPDGLTTQPGAGLRVATSGRAWLWLDPTNTPVAYAFNNRNVCGWASIGPVYTPPEARGRGYGTAVTVAISRALLAAGRTGCTLFTNLANPTANAIYERIGYRRVATAQRFGFQPHSSTLVV
ncbi:MAG: GNAT family N-acetyltransferase [Kofleriaceae bacterium]